MISVFFYCSSPYVGYKLKQADYVNKEMVNVVKKEQMTSLGYECFIQSGSYMLLGKFDGKKFFHTRESDSQKYDEQGRRIFTNLAFVGEDVADENTIIKIAAYAFFEEEKFYKTMSQMIVLLKEGFTVDFDKLSDFINKMSKKSFRFSSFNKDAIAFYQGIMTPNDKPIHFIVTESTWSYFVKQTNNQFNEDSALNILSSIDAKK